jgi:cytochrome c oxidase assembly factor CtaG
MLIYLELLTQAMMIVCGLAVSIHYFLVANFVTKAPKWVKIIVLPMCVGAGLGMVYCAIKSRTDVGLFFSLWGLTSVMVVHLEAWRRGYCISRQFSKTYKPKAINEIPL